MLASPTAIVLFVDPSASLADKPLPWRRAPPRSAASDGPKLV